MKINLDENYNNKLDCPIFTTIRTYTSLKCKIHKNNLYQTHQITLKSKPKIKARLIGVQALKFGHLSRELLRLDTGLVDTSDISKLFAKYGITDCHDKVLVLTFENQGKIRNQKNKK